MRIRLVSALVVVAAIVPVSATLAAGPAAAAKPKPSITCTITGTATISPGVSNTPAKQTLTVTTSLSDCTHSSVAGITSSGSNTTVSTGKKPETCASLATKSKPVKTVNTIDWNNGDTSVDSYSTTLDAGSATVKGKITSGTFDKGKVAASVTYTPGPGQTCGSVPLTSATLSGTYTIS
jgi:hypothetical protein